MRLPRGPKKDPTLTVHNTIHSQFINLSIELVTLGSALKFPPRPKKVAEKYRKKAASTVLLIINRLQVETFVFVAFKPFAPLPVANCSALDKFTRSHDSLGEF
jgi:hypothetical protein